MLKAQSRMTVQRKVILEELSKVCSHPTADEIYTMVRKKLPRISLGTVYRNLDLLTENKQIIKLESAGSTRRYDANLAPHSHVRCLCCGSVDDIFSTPFTQENTPLFLENGYKVLELRVEYDGICPKCQHISKAKTTAFSATA